MENYGTVSIIIPVYKVEKYLRECLDSLCRQTYPYLEILVIDDESPDNSGEIADEFASADARIKVFHEKNRGAAGARNIALNHATGSYITFVDSDDWVEPDYIEKMLAELVFQQADIVQCQFRNETVSGHMDCIYHETRKTVNPEDFIRDMLIHWEYVLLWNKLFRREVIGELRMAEGHCIDDEFYTYKLVLNARRISLIEDILYHYRLRKSGAMGNSEKAVIRYRDQLSFITERYQTIISNFPNLKSLLLEHLTGVLLEVIKNSAWHEESFLAAKKVLRRYFGVIMCDRNIPIGLKKSTVLFMISNRTSILKKYTMAAEDEQSDYFQ